MKSSKFKGVIFNFEVVVNKEVIDISKSAISAVKRFIKKGVKVAFASSTRNCGMALERAGLSGLFHTVVDGNVASRMGLSGKPPPDIFMHAAQNMGVEPCDCVLIVDSPEGVRSGVEGSFGLVVGIADDMGKENLMAVGADMVIGDLSKLKFEDIDDWFKTGLDNSCWNLTYCGFDPATEKLRESLTTVGNGYFGTRGNFEGAKADKATHYPGTYIAGLYNKIPSEVFGKTIFNNDLVNCPNWTMIEVKIGDGDFMRPQNHKIISYRHNLNMKDAVMSRCITFQDDSGRITTIESSRIASMNNPHIGAISLKVTPRNYSSEIIIKSTIDGSVINYGVPRYRDLNSNHLLQIAASSKYPISALHVRTSASNIDIFITSKTVVKKAGAQTGSVPKVETGAGGISEIYSIPAKKGNVYCLEKIVTIFTSKDKCDHSPQKAAKKLLSKASSFKSVFEKHVMEWHKIWRSISYRIEGCRFSQKVIRLHMYHLIVTASKHNQQIDAGLPARGLHGEAYRGHIFWDEVYVFPFYNRQFPQITRSLLLYRYRRLDQARQYAKENGYKGAMYPWQTADDGSEETQIIHYNPVSGKWDPDHSCLQRHVSIAIAYNILEYIFYSNDLKFLHMCGAEMLLEIARFWASICKYDKLSKRYHIDGVMGPDEFHEKYPWSSQAGIKDNAYTNVMVSWLMNETIKIVEKLPKNICKKIFSKIGFERKEMEEWLNIAHKMNVVITEDGIMAQFDGYMRLNEIDWSRYRQKHKNLHRMDRILKAEGDSPDRYKLSKQADTLMLFYLLSPRQVKKTLAIMGYDIGDENEFMKNNYEYYLKKTSHGSTLSYVVHSSILKYLHTHKNDMWQWFSSALKSDIYDMQGGTTPEGIHCGVMGGTIDIVTRSFAGLEFSDSNIIISPRLPRQFRKVGFNVVYRNNKINIEVTHTSIKIRCLRISKSKIQAIFGDNKYELKAKKTIKITYQSL